jgi:hypothetical protein
MQHEGSVAADAIKASFPVGRNYTEHDPIAAAGVTACGYSGMRIFVPSVDLCEHGFHFWIARLVFRIPPIECAQRFIERIVGLFRFGDQAQSELMHEPRLGARVARRIDSFLAPLQHALRLCEGAFPFGMTRRWKKKNLRFDVLCAKLVALNLGRITPERRRLDFDHLSNDFESKPISDGIGSPPRSGSQSHC